MEVNYGHRRLSHTKPKAQGSVRQPSLERNDEAVRERSDWYCLVVIDSVCYGFVQVVRCILSDCDFPPFPPSLMYGPSSFSN